MKSVPVQVTARLIARVAVPLAVLLVALMLAGAPNLGAQSREETRDRMRELMFGNYESLMRVMFLLSERNYAEAVKEVETIQRHAEALAQNLGGRPSLFQTYALSLRARTENLRTLAEMLAGNDRLAPELRRP